ncbi:MAG: hypothetical protein GY756_05440 [bacterium]|nr:hypothetical protein [bacterium]
MNKIKRYLLILAFIFPITLSAFELYEGKKIDVEMNLLVGFDYSYKMTYPPGDSGFKLNNTKLKLETEYLDKYKAVISTDLADIDNEAETLALLKDSYIQIKLHDYFKIRTGQFKIPFGEEYSRGAASRPNIYHSEASDLIVPGRSLGVSLSGKNIFDYLGYELGFFNSTGIEFQENESGHHIFSGQISFKNDFLNSGYNIEYSTDETFAQGGFISLNLDFSENVHFLLFTEYIEQRYFNYHWNNSIYSLIALRIKSVEPLVYFDYYNNKVGYDGVEDKWIIGIGTNKYFLNDKLRMMIDYHTEYHYSMATANNLKFYNHKLTIKMMMEL